MSRTKQWRGLKALVAAAVEHGSIAVEKIQKDSAKRPFAILEQIPQVAVPARGVHEIHDVVVAGTHSVVREVTRAVSASLDVVMDVVDRAEEERGKHR